MTKPDAIFIHGAGGGAWQWRDWLPVFGEAGYGTIARDLQPSDDGLAATSLDDYAHQVLRWIGNPHQPPAIVGASLGGLLGLKIVEHRPLSALVLINTVPPAGTAGWPPRANIYPDIVEWSRGITLGDSRRSMPEADETTLMWAHELWRDESGTVMKAMHAGVPVKRPECPTLVIGCRLDNAVPEQISAALARQWDLDYRIFHNVSHVGALLGVNAKQVARFARDWLSSEVI
ncbi:MAG: alpha/beta fold hydrolase [Gammaproteobacteria bacterium]